MTHASAIIAENEETKQTYNQEVKNESYSVVNQYQTLFSTLTSIENKDLLENPGKPISETTLTKAKQTLALALFLAYRDGNGVQVDEQKADFYLAHYFCMEPPESLFDNALLYLNWFTTWRLGIIARSNRQLCLFPDFPIHNTEDSTKIGSMFPDSFSFLQLSYSLEIIVYLVKIFYYSFRPETQKEAQAYQNKPVISRWYFKLKAAKARFEYSRFHQSIDDNKFTDCISNALVWLLANGIGLYLGGGLGCSIVQILGFCFDIFHDYYFTKKELDTDKESLKILENIEEEGWDKNNLADLKYLSLKKMQDKIKKSSEKATRAVRIAVIIFIGMAIIYFFPLSSYLLHHPFLMMVASWLFSPDKDKSVTYKVAELLQFIGSILVMLGGFFYGGLCGRLWRLPNWKKSGLWLLGSLKSNVPQLVVAGVLAYYIVAPAILSFPIVIASCGAGAGIGATLVLVNTVIVTSILLFAAIKCLIIAAKKIKECLQSPPTALTVNNYPELAKLLKTLLSSADIKNVINTLGSLEKEEREILQKASGFNDSEWLRHVRNWSIKDPLQREASLIYPSFEDFLNALINGRNNVVLPAFPPEALADRPGAAESFISAPLSSGNYASSDEQKDEPPASSANHFAGSLSNPLSLQSSTLLSLAEDKEPAISVSDALIPSSDASAIRQELLNPLSPPLRILTKGHKRVIDELTLPSPKRFCLGQDSCTLFYSGNHEDRNGDVRLENIPVGTPLFRSTSAPAAGQGLPFMRSRL
jgi:hypothetical protein